MRYCAANLQKMYRYERELKAELDRLTSDNLKDSIALSSSKAVIRTIFRDGKSNISGDEFFGMQKKISAQLKQGIPPEVIVPPVLSVAEKKAEKKAKADDIDLRARAFAQEFAKFREKKEAARKEAKRKADKEKAEKEKIALKKKNRFASLKNFFRSEKKTESREDKGMKAG